jgi:glucose/arabinose dehydrogenase
MRAVLAAALAVFILVPPASAAGVRLKRVGTFSQPVYVTSPPGDAGTLAVVERYGRVRLVRHGHVARRPLIDLRGRVRIADRRPGNDQRGLFSLAFAPDYATSGRFYVEYVDRRGRQRVDEGRRGSRSLRHVLDIGRATTKHHGGQLQFGPDGLLYASTGMGDQPSISQDPASLKGKLLRLDPRRRPARPEVVALGLRNPWRFSFDSATGTVLIGDVGELAVEEVDVIPPGAPAGTNFGWPAYEGNHLVPGYAPFPASFPALAHVHSRAWCGVVGGYVAHRHAPRALRGRYVYGDICSGRLWSARLTGTSLIGDARLRLPPVSYLVSLGQDARGRLYAVSILGDVWRLVGQ